MLLLQTPPLVAKPPGPSDGKGDIGSHIKRAMFMESAPKQAVGAVEELAHQVQSEELSAHSCGSIHTMWEGSLHVETKEGKNFDKIKK